MINCYVCLTLCCHSQETQLKVNELLEAESSSDSASSVTVDDGENTPTESGMYMCAVAQE